MGPSMNVVDIKGAGALFPDFNLQKSTLPQCRCDSEFDSAVNCPGGETSMSYATVILSFPNLQESERRSMARDLHDGIGPLITLIKLDLDGARKLLSKSDDAADRVVQAIQRAALNVERTFEELRRTLLKLHPAILDELGIVSALRWLIRQFEQSGVDVSLTGKFSVDDSDVPDVLRIGIFRICQEAINNAVRHADATAIEVALYCLGNELVLKVSDNGVGLPIRAQEAPWPCGGLAGIAIRASSVGGVMTIVSEPGCGASIVVKWKLQSSMSRSV